MEKNTNSEQIAKNNTRQIATEESDSTDTLDAERPEIPEDMEENDMMRGPMGGGFPGEMTSTTVATESDPWLVPMVATSIISGVMILSAVAVCLTVFFTRKKN
ncbi:hypothetical protein IJ101_01500 [Candidatus Saccharibacteria bacterium]|nr:hypothetical protein [Candidatus Saccharibacteria bacterium]